MFAFVYIVECCLLNSYILHHHIPPWEHAILGREKYMIKFQVEPASKQGAQLLRGSRFDVQTLASSVLHLRTMSLFYTSYHITQEEITKPWPWPNQEHSNYFTNNRLERRVG